MNYFIERKANLNDYFNFRQFNDCMRYAKEHISLIGVPEIIAKLRKNGEDFSLTQNAFIAEKTPPLDTVYEKYLKVANIADKCLRVRFVPLIAFVVLFILNLVMSSIFHSRFMYYLSLVVGLLSTVSFFVAPIMIITSKILIYLANKKKDSYLSSLNRNIKEIQSFLDLFDYSNRQLYQEIDDLYLASLDATQRELVLMRREQAEARKAQDEHNKEMRRMQETHNREQVRYQERATRASEGLLEIEKERERRMRGY